MPSQPAHHGAHAMAWTRGPSTTTFQQDMDVNSVRHLLQSITVLVFRSADKTKKVCSSFQVDISSRGADQA